MIKNGDLVICVSKNPIEFPYATYNVGDIVKIRRVVYPMGEPCFFQEEGEPYLFRIIDFKKYEYREEKLKRIL
jgi:hypothetical protein